MDGLRKCLTDEFTTIYCFNLRGNQRTSGETSRMEGGKIFGSGSRASIAITMLIKNPEHQGACELFYHDIGDYLSREDKLKIIDGFKGLNGIQWKKITPNDNHDWINQRNEVFESFIAMGNKDRNNAEKTIFDNYSQGVLTARDSWVYNFSKTILISKVKTTIEFYNSQVKEYQILCGDKPRSQRPNLEKFVSNDMKKISWSTSLKSFLERFLSITYKENSLSQSMYRPFQKQWLYFDGYLNHRVGQFPKIFPNNEVENLVISVTGIGETIKSFSALITNTIPNLQLHSVGQCFSLYTYEKIDIAESVLFDTPAENSYRKKDNITDAILQDLKHRYDANIGKEDIFYYVYGVLHSPEYKQRFAADLKKMLPRIPFTQDFWVFSKAGRDLAELHIHYETVDLYPVTVECGTTTLDDLTDADFYVTQMKFAKKGDKSTVIYNHKITITNIPIAAYDYVVNGKPALEWVMERQAVSTHKDSGIVNDANDWAIDTIGNARYSLELFQRVITVSLETMKIVNALPRLDITINQDLAK